MTSFMGNSFRFFIRHFFNVNPETCKDQIKGILMLEKGMSYETNKGYEIFREKTEDGILYERVNKIGAEKNGKVILYLHGGAYIAGLIGTYRKMAKTLSEAAGGAEVYFLDYKCAPGAKFPSQLNEAYGFWQELTEKRGYRPENIIVGGDSAGGNLTLALLLKLRDNGLEMPKAAFCISPWADMTGSGQSYFDNYAIDVMFGKKKGKLTPELREELLKSDIYTYVGDADRKDPYVSPVYGDYHGFPPMFFTVGEDEMLLSDTLTIVQKLKDCGIEVQLESQKKMFHIYTVYYTAVPEAKVSYGKILKFISEKMQ